MGFEQLAELRAQLAAKAKQERNAKRPAAQPDAGAKPKSGDRPARGAKSGPAAKAPSGAKPASAKPSTPVDPVIVAIGKLQRRFPRAFPKNPAPKVPLKVGIWDDLAREAQAVGLTEAELRDAMSTWCRGNRYWSCLVEDAVRVDLQGNEAGRVTHDDAARARRLKSRRPGNKGGAQAAKGAPQQPKAEAQADAAAPQPATDAASANAAPVNAAPANAAPADAAPANAAPANAAPANAAPANAAPANAAPANAAPQAEQQTAASE
ncbi:ProQ/FinO family protein [Burkholderia sp. 567]|uniref:ProQ/FinO family protein n=1 Tax=Burkholderia sp. 567 TaxID=3156413 RepID=UPI0033976985